MTSYFSGWLRGAVRNFANYVPALPRTSSGHTGLHVEQFEPRQQCAVEVLQDGNYIVVDGLPDANSLQIQHLAGDAPNSYDDQVLVTWTSQGVPQAKSFDLYKFVESGDQRWAVKNVEYLEVSGGSGRNRFWTQTRLASYWNEAAATRQAREQVFGDENGSFWKRNKAS